MRNNDNAYQAIFNAAQVIALDKRILAWLTDHDPQALAQLHGAIKAVQAEIDRSTALAALAEKFDGITAITFLTSAQESAVLGLLEDAAGTLMLRGRSRLSQKLGADVGHVKLKYHEALHAEQKTPHTKRGA